MSPLSSRPDSSASAHLVLASLQAPAALMKPRHQLLKMPWARSSPAYSAASQGLAAVPAALSCRPTRCTTFWGATWTTCGRRHQAVEVAAVQPLRVMQLSMQTSMPASLPARMPAHWQC